MAIALYAAVLLEGAMLSVPGPTLDSLAELTGSNLGDIGILFTANGLGFVAGAFMAGRLFARLMGTRLLAIALSAMGAMSLLVPTLDSLVGTTGDDLCGGVGHRCRAGGVRPHPIPCRPYERAPGSRDLIP